ncbi:MAG TPA: 2-dehydropantoate 2-reductase N-terminal domain-containing protein [Anaeromyxobacteraceae bacterium]|nr:2-dehydropantoate 2-reductase N-terminal domain-containing protein [Anaeromyxobacteraceae bacterium]
MRILVYGAGVVGSLYGARLAEAGHEVVLLARGRRLAELRQHGVILEEARTGARTQVHVPVFDRLWPGDPWDLVVVAVLRQSVRAILPDLRASAAPSVLFLVTTAVHPQRWIEAVGEERFLAGIPGAGGERRGPVVRYSIAPPLLFPTVLGEPGPKVGPRLRRVAQAFREAGFAVAARGGIEDWVRTHAAIATPVAQALHAAGGDPRRLARSGRLLDLLVRSVGENLSALEMDGVRIRPLHLASFGNAPAPLLRALLRRVLGSPHARNAVAPHARASRAEVRAIAADLRQLAEGCWLLAEAGERLEEAAEASAGPPAG